MTKTEIWYHDPAEADIELSWIANSIFLQNCRQGSLDRCPYSRVLALAEYAQPDIVISCDGVPILSIELTRMNPSGHNLPQRFSCLVRAAELGVPSLFYYPEYARRSDSDPNPRYLNVRVPLGQFRLTQIFNVPSFSMFWPTNPETLLAESGLKAHKKLANMVTKIALKAESGTMLTANDRLVLPLYNLMKKAVLKYGTKKGYPSNSSFRIYFPDGDIFTKAFTKTDHSIDPPNSCKLLKTIDLLTDLFKLSNKKVPKNRKTNLLLSRELSLVYKGTPNSSKDGPEHPYPGYLTLLDILYARQEKAQSSIERNFNLGFDLPITLDKFRQKALDRPTGLNILMEFADIIKLNDAVVVGGFIRNLSAGAILIHE